DTAFEDDRGFGEFDYAEEIDDDDDNDDNDEEEDETGASQSQSHSEADDSLVFLGATSRNPAVNRRRTVFLDDDDDDDDEVQVTGVTRRNHSHDQNDEEDPDEALARRLQEEEYAALQSNNMVTPQQNIQQLFGILHPDESEDEDAPVPPNLQLDDYRTRQRLRELERQEALEMAQQAAMAAAAARRGGIRATRATSRVSAPSRGVATRRGRRTRGQLFEDDDEDEEDGVAAGGFPFHDGLPPGLAGMLYGGAFGLQGHRLMGRGGGSAGNALHGLIPELYGAGVAYNPGNYVDDDNFDTSYENLIQLGERIGSAKPKGVRKPVLDSLPTKKFKAQNGSSGSGSSSSSSSTTTANNSSEDDAKCAICLMEFEDGEEVSGVPCLHWFHEPCIKKWLQDSSVCPM
ncbi:hypothetical protein HDU99_004161, partial [Rhizoclosmatium hyalinum]